MADTFAPNSPVDAAPLIELEPRIHWFEGMAYGLAHPTLVCHLRIREDASLSLTHLDRAMALLIDEPWTGEESHPIDVVHAMMARVNHWQGALQRTYDIPVFGGCHARVLRADQIDTAGKPVQGLCAMPYFHPTVSRASLKWVVMALNEIHRSPGAIEKTSDKLASELKRMEPDFKAVQLQGTNRLHFLEAAYLLGMPVLNMNKDLCAIGTGIYSRWFSSSVTDRASYMGVTFARNKRVSAHVLGQFGLPVPLHRRVETEKQALAAAEALDWPVVVKPEDRDQGEGVFAGLTSRDRLVTSFRECRRVSRHILVEKHYQGEDYRFTVLLGKVIKVMHRRPASVVGDGNKTVAELVEELQRESRHQHAYRRTGKNRVELDAEALELLREQGMTPSSVPAGDMEVVLRGKSNISSGGTHELVPLSHIHSANCALAVRAARFLELDLAGVDLIIPDVARPWQETGGVICEINAQPQIGYRDTPTLYQHILQELVGSQGAIPLHLMVLDEEPDEQTFLACRHYAGRLDCNGISGAPGVFVDGEHCVVRPGNAFAAARAMLFDKTVYRGLVVMSAEDVRRYGLPAPFFQTARVMAELLNEQRSDDINRQRYLREQVQRHAGKVLMFSLQGRETANEH